MEKKLLTIIENCLEMAQSKDGNRQRALYLLALWSIKELAIEEINKK